MGGGILSNQELIKSGKVLSFPPLPTEDVIVLFSEAAPLWSLLIHFSSADFLIQFCPLFALPLPFLVPYVRFREHSWLRDITNESFDAQRGLQGKEPAVKNTVIFEPKHYIVPFYTLYYSPKTCILLTKHQQCHLTTVDVKCTSIVLHYVQIYLCSESSTKNADWVCK